MSGIFWGVLGSVLRTEHVKQVKLFLIALQKGGSFSETQELSVQVLQIRDSALFGWSLVFQLPRMPTQGLRAGQANVIRVAVLDTRLAPRLRHAL